MQLSQSIMKFTSFLCLFGCFITIVSAQVTDKSNRIKIDGVSAVIGDYVILNSDIDKTLVEMESQGVNTKGISRCQLLGKLMEDKLYAHHAVQDSLEVSVEEIYSTVDQIIDNFLGLVVTCPFFRIMDIVFVSMRLMIVECFLFCFPC